MMLYRFLTIGLALSSVSLHGQNVTTDSTLVDSTKTIDLREVVVSQKVVQHKANQLTNLSTHKLINTQTYKLINSQTHNPINSQTYKLTSSSTHKLINSQAHQLINLKSCQLFSVIFNILSALFVHPSSTLLQIIDSREGWFWCKKGWVVNASKMNIYFKDPPFAPYFGQFTAKFSAFWC